MCIDCSLTPKRVITYEIHQGENVVCVELTLNNLRVQTRTGKVAFSAGSVIAVLLSRRTAMTERECTYICVCQASHSNKSLVFLTEATFFCSFCHGYCIVTISTLHLEVYSGSPLTSCQLTTKLICASDCSCVMEIFTYLVAFSWKLCSPRLIVYTSMYNSVLIPRP